LFEIFIILKPTAEVGALDMDWGGAWFEFRPRNWLPSLQETSVKADGKQSSLPSSSLSLRP
jgi:hypothetical protein